MTPREANYIRHSQPLTPKSQASTYVRQVTELFCVRFVQWYASKPRFAGVTCIPGNCNSPSRRQVVCVRGTSWGESTGASVGCQIREGSNMSPKIFRLWTGEFHSPSSPRSRRRAGRYATWLITRDATPAPRNDGSLARALRPAAPAMSFSPTSCLAFNDRRAA